MFSIHIVMRICVNFKSLTQLPGVRVTSPQFRPIQPAAPAANQLHHLPDATPSLKTDASTYASQFGGQDTIMRPPDFRLSFDDYDADLELAWLGYVLATCQSETHLNVPAAAATENTASEFGGYNRGSRSSRGGYNQRLAVSSFDIRPHDDQYSQDDHLSLSTPFSSFSSYARSRSDTCLAPDRCATYSIRL